MYAPFGAGLLVGPRQELAAADPFSGGGGEVPVPGPDEVARMARQEQEDPGSPNVIGTVAPGAGAPYRPGNPEPASGAAAAPRRT